MSTAMEEAVRRLPKSLCLSDAMRLVEYKDAYDVDAINDLADEIAVRDATPVKEGEDIIW